MQSFGEQLIYHFQQLFFGIAETFKEIYVGITNKYWIVFAWCSGIFCIILLIYCACRIVSSILHRH